MFSYILNFLIKTIYYSGVEIWNEIFNPLIFDFSLELIQDSELLKNEKSTNL